MGKTCALVQPDRRGIFGRDEIAAQREAGVKVCRSDLPQRLEGKPLPSFGGNDQDADGKSVIRAINRNAACIGGVFV